MSEDLSNGLFSVQCDCGIEFAAEDRECACGKSKGNLILDTDLFLNRLYAYSAENKIDLAIDSVFDVFHHLYNKFDLMNEILSKTDVSKITPSIMVSLLSKTFKYIKQVPSHLDFCDRSASQMKSLNYDDNRISKLVDCYRTDQNYWKNMNDLGAPEWMTGPKPKD